MAPVGHLAAAIIVTAAIAVAITTTEGSFALEISFDYSWTVDDSVAIGASHYFAIYGVITAIENPDSNFGITILEAIAATIATTTLAIATMAGSTSAAVLVRAFGCFGLAPEITHHEYADFEAL